MRYIRLATATTLVAAVACAVAAAPAPRPVPDGDWLGFGRTSDNIRHSPLTEITPENVAQLGRVYTDDFKKIDPGVKIGEQSYPVAVGGQLYVTTNDDNVFRIDGATGKVVWQFKPSDSGVFKNFGIVANRGVAYCDGKLFLLTLDMHIDSLSPLDGHLIKRVTIAHDVPGAGSNYGYSETSAPMCANHRVVFGAAGSEYGTRGFVMAYTTEPRARLAEPVLDDPARAAELARREPHRRRRQRLDPGHRRHGDRHRVLRNRLGDAALLPLHAPRAEPAHRLADRRRPEDRARRSGGSS